MHHLHSHLLVALQHLILLFQVHVLITLFGASCHKFSLSTQHCSCSTSCLEAMNCCPSHSSSAYVVCFSCCRFLIVAFLFSTSKLLVPRVSCLVFLLLSQDYNPGSSLFSSAHVSLRTEHSMKSFCLTLVWSSLSHV